MRMTSEAKEEKSKRSLRRKQLPVGALTEFGQFKCRQQLGQGLATDTRRANCRATVEPGKWPPPATRTRILPPKTYKFEISILEAFKEGLRHHGSRKKAESRLTLMILSLCSTLLFNRNRRQSRYVAGRRHRFSPGLRSDARPYRESPPAGTWHSFA